MKTFLPIFISLSFFLFEKSYSKTYYVSPAGANTNSGLTTDLSWATLTYAAGASSPVVAGDTVYVKSGNYAPEHVVFAKSGTSIDPIVYEGYAAIPGDSPKLNFVIGMPLNSSIMPLLDGGNRASGIAFNLSGRSYVVLKNFQITNHSYGVSTGNGHHLTLDNITITNIGDTISSYSGYGILLGISGSVASDNNTLNNCVVVNSAAEGYGINGNNNTLNNCKVYCNQGLTGNAATDYYITISGNNNSFTGCYANRIGNLAHTGHGIGVKGNCQNNVFTDCESINMGADFYVRHRGAKYNKFIHCKAFKKDGFIIRDGASYNTFEGCIADSTGSSIQMFDTSEDGGSQYTGRNNVFYNCIFKNSDFGIDFDAYDQVSPADSTIFTNCTFHNMNYLVYCGRPNNENKIVNCIISKVTNLNAGGFKTPFQFSLTYSCFYNGFSAPSGTGNISQNPLFLNTSAEDFRIPYNSPCVNAGITNVYAINDFDGTIRPQGVSLDIGAFEYFVNLNTITSSTVVCLGEPVILDGSGAVTTTWSDGVTNGVPFVPTVSKTYTLVGTSGSFSNYKTVAINVIPLPTLSATVSDSVVCLGQTITLNGEGATFYQWNDSIQNGVEFKPSKTSTYTLTGTSNGCSTFTTKTIFVNPLPQVKATTSDSIICQGESVVLKGIGAINYSWSNNVIDSASFSPTNTEKYTLIGTDANGCSNTDSVLILVEVCAGISTNSVKNDINIYYNSIDGYAIESLRKINKIIMIDILGNELMTLVPNSLEANIQISHLINGIYFLQIIAGENQQIEPILVNK